MAMDGSHPEEMAVGCLLSIKTCLGDEFEGQVIAFDRPSNILVLQEGSKLGTPRNIRLLKANYIKELNFLGQSEDPLAPAQCFLDLAALQAREELAIRSSLSSTSSGKSGWIFTISKLASGFSIFVEYGISDVNFGMYRRQAETDAERIGVGVTTDAQSIFDALSKTLPVRWDKTVIVVMNEVRVNSPYLPESVSGGTPAANERVKKVLEFERKRLNLHNNSAQ